MPENSGNGGFAAGGSATPFSVNDQEIETVMVQGKKGVFAPSPPDGQYKKANSKGEIKEAHLNATNYLQWSRDMQLQLKAKSMWPIISGSVFSSDPEIRPVDYENWVNDDNQAQAWININVELAQRNHLENISSSYDMWERFKKVHGTQFKPGERQES